MTNLLINIQSWRHVQKSVNKANFSELARSLPLASSTYQTSFTQRQPTLINSDILTRTNIFRRSIHTSKPSYQSTSIKNVGLIDTFVSNREYTSLHINENVSRGEAEINNMEEIINQLLNLNTDVLVRDLNTNYKSRGYSEHQRISTVEATELSSPETESKWIKKCIEYLDSEDYSNLQNHIIYGARHKYSMTTKDLSSVITKLSSSGQYPLSLAAFRLFENSSIKSTLSGEVKDYPLSDFSPDIIDLVIHSAFVNRDYHSCASIFLRYCKHLSLSEDSICHSVRSYYGMSQPIEGFHFLRQVWDQATDKAVIVAVRCIASVTADSLEIYNLFFEWKKEHVISAELYSAVLEQFLFLDDISRFIEISKLAEQEGHANHPKVQEVMFQKLLHEKNTTQIQAFISMIQSKKNGISFSTNPLDNAVSHFAWKKDGPGVALVVDLYPQLGLPYSSRVVNSLLSLIIAKGDPTGLIDYLEEFADNGIVGSNATTNLLWKALTKVYESQAVYITHSFKKMKTKYPTLFSNLLPNSFDLYRIIKNKHGTSTRRNLLVNSSQYPNGVLAALRKIEVYNAEGNSLAGIQVIEELKSRHVKPTPQMYHALLSGMCRGGFKNEINRVLKMMESEGYKPTVDLEAVFLVTHLASLRKAEKFQRTLRSLALTNLKNFVSAHKDTFKRQTAVSIGFEYLRWEDYDSAIQLFNFYRIQQSENNMLPPLSYSNHNYHSLSGLILAYSSSHQTDKVKLLLLELLSASDARIDLRTFFHRTLKKVIAVEFERKNVQIARELQELAARLDQVNKEFIKANIEEDLTKIENIFAKWESALKTYQAVEIQK